MRNSLTDGREFNLILKGFEIEKLFSSQSSTQKKQPRPHKTYTHHQWKGKGFVLNHIINLETIWKPNSFFCTNIAVISISL